jgi:hypothetical protein
MEQQPAAESIVHDLAKPVARAVSWAAVAAAALALAAGAVRNARG